MNQIITTATELGQCDMQALETATAIVHLNAPETLTAANTIPTSTASNRLAACDICSKIFSRYNLERHKRTHRGEKLFSCVICARSFSQKSHLTVHERIHTGERPFKCNICGCAFSRKDYLVRHTWTQHSGKVYTINNQTVTTPIIPPAKQQRAKKSSKTVNVTMTSAMPPPQLATNSTYLQQQADPPPLPPPPPPPATTTTAEEVVAVPQEPMPDQFDCEECWKEYTQSQQQLQQSSMNFTKFNNEEIPLLSLYVCDICGKAFPASGKLTTHRKTHTRPKIFICDVCQKAFSRRDHLNVHKQIHTGERPYKCDVCGYAFTRIDHLMRHKRPNKGMRKLSCVPRVVMDMPTGDGSPLTAAVEDDGNTSTQVVVSAAIAAATPTVPTTIVVPSHNVNSIAPNGQPTTITTLTNVPHHVTVQPLYHANIPQQITVPFHPQQLDVATMQIYTTTK